MGLTGTSIKVLNAPLIQICRDLLGSLLVFLKVHPFTEVR